MQVFLSWSGSRSKALAEALAGWISEVVQVVEPWLSSDIEKGTRWSPEIASRLEQSKVGIICLTPENIGEPWVLFEAGALSKTPDAHVCTCLVDLSPGDVEPPLGQFQHTVAEDKSDVHRLVRTINQAVHKHGERALSEATLDNVFTTNWERLADVIRTIAGATPSATASVRPERELLEEILQTVRHQERRLAQVSHDLENVARRTKGRALGEDPRFQRNMKFDEQVLLNYIRRAILEKKVQKEERSGDDDMTTKGPDSPDLG